MNPITKKIHLSQLIVSLAGFCAGLYALVLHLQKALGKQQLSCDINNTLSCSQVLFSSYGDIFGVPLGAFGMSFFSLAILLNILPKLSQETPSQVAPWSVALGAIGSICVGFLAYISYIKLQSVCLVCATTHILTFLYTGLSFFVFFRLKKEETPPRPTTALAKLIPFGLAFGLPPLAAGGVAPHIMSLLVDSPTSSASTTEDSPLAPAFPPELLKVSKSQFVGKGEDFRLGNDDAPVVVHAFSDMECPFCKSVDEMFQAVVAEVGAQNILYVFRNFPLSNRCNPEVKAQGHPFACRLAKAARCAGQQGKFWEFKAWAYSHLETPPQKKGELLEEGALRSQAIALGLDARPFMSCLESSSEDEKIKEDAKVGIALGLEGTPLIVINNRKYTGDFSVKALVRHIRGLLRESGTGPK